MIQRHALGMNLRTEGEPINKLSDKKHPVDVCGGEELNQDADDGNPARDSNGPTSSIKARVSNSKTPTEKTRTPTDQKSNPTKDRRTCPRSS